MAIPISEAQAELISSLSPDDIPIKLRCAICSKLAINAFRLPCCEQAICESCQSDLPPSCPVCEHSPLSAEDCNPNKSLRTTIRVFLRTAEKKREASRPKQPAPATPVAEPKSTPAEPQPASDNDASATTNASGQESADKEGEQTAPVTSVSQDAPASDQADISHGDEAKTETGPLPPAADPSSHGDEDRVNGESQEVQNSDGQQLGQAGEDVGDENEDENETENEKENYGTDAMNSGYNSAMFSGPGDLNQMQMMMAMQNGMAPGSFGNFSMMGMPGMGMDPMAMQNMYMNGGFQGMGMNGMGGSYGGGFGQGSNMNDWSGSQSWNFDQNNYNQNGTGMGTGDFGNFNSGFQTGYNQGNYGHINDYRRGNFGRGRGRARGAFGSYGRGGYQYHGLSNYQGHGHAQAQYMQQQQQQQQQHSHQQPQPQPQAQGVQAYAGQVQDATSTNGNADEGSEQTANRDSGGQGAGIDLPSAGGVEGQQIEASSSGDAQGNANGTGAIQSVLPAQDVPINAPTGPKAMRQGLPNTSLHNLRARGYPVGNEAQFQINTGTPQPIPRPATVKVGPRSDISLDREQEMQTAHDANREPSKDHEIRDRSNLGSQPPPSRNRSPSRSQMGSVLQSRSGSKNRDRGRDMERSRTRSPSRSRTASRSRKSSHRRRRQRSESVNEDEDDEGPRRKKHHSSSYKKPFYGGDDDQPPENKQTDPSRSRSASPQSVKKSTHYRSSHRDKDRTRDSEIRRDRDKDKYRDDEKTKSSRSSHRSSHKDKDRDYDNSSSRRRDKDRDRKDRKERRRDRDRDRDRIRDRDRDRDRGSVRDRDRGDKTHTSTSSRRASPSRDRDKPSHSESTDPHTLEREARNRERLLKEAQRMAGLASLAGSKRSRDELGDDAGPTSRRDRRTGRRTEARDGVDEEERMRRLEAEREGGRWG